jgi:hypothetical protein
MTSCRMRRKKENRQPIAVPVASSRLAPRASRLTLLLSCQPFFVFFHCLASLFLEFDYPEHVKNPMRKNEECSAVAAFDLIFWASETADHPSASLEIQVPSWWAPRIMLAALRLALKRSKGVITAHRVENNFEWMPVPILGTVLP